VSAGAYAAGAAFFVTVVGVSALTAWLIVGRLRHLAGAPRWLAAAVVFTFALMAAHLVPGALGILTRGTALAAAALGCVVTWAVLRGRPGPVAAHPVTDPPAERGSRLAAALAVLAGAALAACIVGYLRTEATRSVVGNDMLNFHMPLIARWIQSGSFWPVVQYLPYDATGNYPQNGDVLMLASVLPWRADAFVRFAMLPYMALMGLATYALGRELRAGAGQAALMACFAVVTPIVLVATVVASLPDVVMYGTFGAGLVFLLRCARTDLRSDAVLAGLGLGIAFGTKWYGVPEVVTMIVLFAAALLAQRRAWRDVARRAGIVCGMVALAGGFWLVRNAVESGSPFFPGGWIPIGARADVGSPLPRADFPLVHYLFDGQVLRHIILPDELRAFGWGGLLLLVGVLAAGVLAVRTARRGEREAWPVAWAALAALVLFAVYWVTPNTASGFEGKPAVVYYNARYLVPAVVPAAAVLAWTAARLGRIGALIELLAAVAIADDLRRAFSIPAKDMVIGIVVVAVAAAALWVLWRATGALRLAGLAAGVLLIAVGGYALETRYFDHRLRGQDATIDRFIVDSRPGQRVALAEQWSVMQPSPVFPLFGDRMRNSVTYVGLHEEGARKPYRDPAQFEAAMRRGRYDWLMVGRGLRPGGVTPTMRWARAAGYAQVASSPRLALYRRLGAP
jgi:hypothetical protein